MHGLKDSPKRIVIIGSAGVGKTTLLEKLKSKLGLKAIPEQARTVCKELGFKNIYEIEKPNYFRQLTLKTQIKKEEVLKEFISDRSTIDCWVHWVRWSWSSATTAESEKYYKLAFSQALKYSHIIFIPRSFTFKAENDGFRWNNEEYQNQIDRLFREILLDWNLMNRTYIIQSNNLNERIKEIKRFFKD